MDLAYEERLIDLIDQSSLDAVLLLAMDYPYDEDGNCLQTKAKFYVPMIMCFPWRKNTTRSYLPAPFIQVGRMGSRNSNAAWQAEPRCSSFYPTATT